MDREGSRTPEKKIEQRKTGEGVRNAGGSSRRRHRPLSKTLKRRRTQAPGQQAGPVVSQKKRSLNLTPLIMACSGGKTERVQSLAPKQSNLSFRNPSAFCVLVGVCHCSSAFLFSSVSPISCK